MIKSQLGALQFVLRSDDRGLVPAFGCLHFYEHNGEPRVQTTSGIITFDAPWVGNPLNVTVPMNPVIRCMEAAPEEKARIVVNKRGDLMIKVADYSSKLVPFMDEFPRMTSEWKGGQENAHAIPAVVWNGEVAKAIELLRGFVSADATRPWSQVMLIRGGALHATNNVVYAQYPLPHLEHLEHDVLLDVDVIDQILRIRALGHEVALITLSPTELLCEFADGAWASYRSQNVEWPSLSSFINVLAEGEDEVAPDLLIKLNTISSIAGVATDGVVYLYEHGAIVQMEKTSARVWCGSFKRASFMRSSIQQVLAVAERWSPANYPSVVQFAGQGVRGVMMGTRGANEAIDVLLQGDTDDASI